MCFNVCRSDNTGAERGDDRLSKSDFSDLHVGLCMPQLLTAKENRIEMEAFNCVANTCKFRPFNDRISRKAYSWFCRRCWMKNCPIKCYSQSSELIDNGPIISCNSKECFRYFVSKSTWRQNQQWVKQLFRVQILFGRLHNLWNSNGRYARTRARSRARSFARSAKYGHIGDGMK